MKVNRVIMIVLDSLGIGALADAASYGDEGSNTLRHILEGNPNLRIPNLTEMGLLNIRGVLDSSLGSAAPSAIAEKSSGVELTPGNGQTQAESTDSHVGLAASSAIAEKSSVFALMPATAPKAAYARAMEASKGKDTITGHWEIAGLMTSTPFKSYERFPDEFMRAFETRIGVGTLGNFAASGTEIIERLGAEHEKSGKPIIYTSADSVFQIAANTDVIALARLYEICEIAREMLVGDISVGRVIARPYIISGGKRIRTSDRKDYAVSPPCPTLLDNVKDAGMRVCAIGKISDIFNGCGVSDSHHTEDNMDGVDQTLAAMEQDFKGLIFTNLVDFDSKYGHRRDCRGYGKALEEFDARLPELVSALRADDLMILCADHGNDPIHSGWDHTREAIPVLIYGSGVRPVDLGVRESFADIGQTIAEVLGVAPTPTGSLIQLA